MKVTNTGNKSAKKLTARVYIGEKELLCFWVSFGNETWEKKADVGSAIMSIDLIDDGEAYLAIMSFQFGVGWLALGLPSSDLSCLKQATQSPGDEGFPWNRYRLGSDSPEVRYQSGQLVTVQFKAGKFIETFEVVLVQNEGEHPRLEHGD